MYRGQCCRHSRHVAPARKGSAVAHRRHQRRRVDAADPGHRRQPSASIVRARLGHELGIEGRNPVVERSAASLPLRSSRSPFFCALTWHEHIPVTSAGPGAPVPPTAAPSECAPQYASIATTHEHHCRENPATRSGTSRPLLGGSIPANPLCYWRH